MRSRIEREGEEEWREFSQSTLEVRVEMAEDGSSRSVRGSQRRVGAWSEQFHLSHSLVQLGREGRVLGTNLRKGYCREDEIEIEIETLDTIAGHNDVFWFRFEMTNTTTFTISVSSYLVLLNSLARKAPLKLSDTVLEETSIHRETETRTRNWTEHHSASNKG